VLALAFAGSPAAAAPLAAPAGQASGADVQILAADAAGLTIQLTAPPYQVATVTRDGAAFAEVQVTAAGWAQAGAPGAPQLPERGLLLAAPPSGAVTIAVEAAQPAVVAESLLLQPAPQVSAPPDVGTEGYPLQESWQVDPAAYAQDAWLPAAQAEITEEGWLRGVRFVRVVLRPFQYNSARGALQATPTLRVRVSFAAPAATAAPLPPDPVFDSVLAATFPNYQQASDWRVRPQPAAAPATTAERQVSGGPWVKVTVKVDGLTRVTYNDLANAGVALTGIDPRTFRLLDEGQEQHIYVSGEGDGVFNGADAIYFYGLRTKAYLTNDKNVYWLTWGGAAGQRMATQDGAPGAASAATLLAEARAEQNVTYNSYRPFAKWLQPVDHDHWYWEQIKTSKDVSLTGMQVAIGAGVPPVLSVLLVGQKQNAGSYTVDVKLNGQTAGALNWSDKALLNGALSLPADVLVNGTNTVSLAPRDLVSGEDDTVWLDWVSLEYPYNGQFLSGATFRSRDAGVWRFQINGAPTNAPWILNLGSDPAQPKRVVNASASGSSGNFTLAWQVDASAADRFLVVPDADLKAPLSVESFVDAGLLDANQQVDYVMISHKDFMSAAQPLANLHASRGLTTRIVDVQQIYDNFSDGTMSFEAIRAYLAFAYSNYQWPPPAYALLVGDGTIDFRDYQYDAGSVHLTNWIPPYVGAFDYWEGTSVAEGAFGFIEGSDVLPEVLIGRLPANSTSEAQLLVSKITGYLTAAPADWTKRTLWVADNPDNAGDFHTSSDDTIAHLLPEFQATKVYYTPVAGSPAGNCGYSRNQAVCQVNQSIISNINQGQLLINYSGHGTYGAWAHEWLFINPDVSKLTNGNGKLGFTVVSACDTAFFARFDNHGLEERLMRHTSGGIVGGFAPTTFDILTSQARLVQNFYDALMLDRLTHVGVAGAVARARTYAALPWPFSEITAVGHAIMGDPALQLPRPSAECAAGDVDCDGAIDIVDVQKVANAWNSAAWSDAAYNPRADLDGNRQIDVYDIIAVASLWGATR
jgi:hypothetical protein